MYLNHTVMYVELITFNDTSSLITLQVEKLTLQEHSRLCMYVHAHLLGI